MHPKITVALLLSHLLLVVESMVTLETIRNLTSITNDCRGLITTKTERGLGEVDPMIAVLGGQAVLDLGDDVDDVEEVSGFDLHRCQGWR